MRFMHSGATGGSAACFLFLFLSNFLPLNPRPTQLLSQAGLLQTAGCSDLTREGGAAEAGRRGKAPYRLPSPGQEEKRPMENESLPPLPTFSPAVPPYVKLGLTVAYTVFYSLLFAFVYAQLWLVLRYRHKRFSYQTVFLFLCLLWAALRALLFSFYFRNCVTANTLGPFSFWLLYCFPVCLQFFTLSLMNLYFAQVS